MIAASGPSTAAPAPKPGSGASAPQPPSTDAAGRPRGNAAGQVPANESRRDASTTREAGATDATARDRETPVGEERDAPAFAVLLAVDTGDKPAAARDAADAAAGDAPAAAAAADLPDHLLSLLAGSWAIVPEVAPAATSAPVDPLAGAGAGAGAAGTAPGRLPGLPAPAAAAGNPGMGTTATADAANAAGSDPDVAALARLAGDAATASAATDASAPPTDALQAATPLAGTAPVANNARPVAAVPGTPLPMPANPDAGFDDGFGARIAWMAEQRLGHAEIRLNPEHIGPIEVRVQLDGTRVSAEFHSTHADVRQAIEASMPRLREMLGQQGLQLGHADVGQRQAQGQPAQRDHAGDTDAGGVDRDAGFGAVPAPTALRSRGLLDEYA